MVKVFLDTNVLLDHALLRANGEPVEANEILELAESYSIEAYISQGSLYTLSYVLKKALGKVKADAALTGYLSILRIGSLTNTGAQMAIQSGIKDTEDGFQYLTALENNCNFFITRNLKDFENIKKESLPCYSPKEFLMIL